MAPGQVCLTRRSGRKIKPVIPRKKLKLQIDEGAWRAYLWDEETFETKIHDGVSALTIGDVKLIHFKREDISLGLVTHEMMHATLWRSLVDAGGLGRDDTEEVMCSGMERTWTGFLKNVFRIYAAFGLKKPALKLLDELREILD